MPSPTHSLRRLFALSLLLASGAVSAAGQKLYVAPTDETVFMETEQGRGEAPAHVFYVTNRSTEKVIVFGFGLSACENIKQRCESYPLKIELAPGQRRQVFRVDALNPTRGFTYRSRFSWRGVRDVPVPVPPTANASAPEPIPATASPAVELPDPLAGSVFPFRARSITARLVTTDDVSGVAEIRQRDIRIILQSGYLGVSMTSGSRPEAIHAALAYGDTASWNTVSQGPSVRTSAIRTVGDTLADVVELIVPRPAGIDLTKHWITIIVEAQVNVPGRGWVSGGSRPIHADPTMFRASRP